LIWKPNIRSANFPSRAAGHHGTWTLRLRLRKEHDLHGKGTESGISSFEKASYLIGYNINGFDLPVLQAYYRVT
jgi:hypothetical protein